MDPIILRVSLNARKYIDTPANNVPNIRKDAPIFPTGKRIEAMSMVEAGTRFCPNVR